MDAPWLADLARQLAEADSHSFWLWTLVSLLLGAGAFWGCFAALKKARLIDNTPTSRIRSAAQGYVELEGHARLLPGPDILSPLSGQRCCWWKYQVERQETVVRNGKRTSEWRTIESDTSESLFLLVDPTGECVVDPQGASIDPSLRRQWRGSTRQPQQVPDKTPFLQLGGDYRYTESLIQVGDPLYTLGQFRSQTAHLELNEGAETAALLRDWKADQALLLQRFDRNGDGEIDLGEWEAIRAAALEQVRAAALERTLDTDIHVLCRAPDRRPFIVSTHSQAQLTRRHRLWAAFWLLLSFCASTGGVFALTARGLL
ncbi:MAG TPA: GIDE domain-containing protein [Fontimonas sp.]